MVTCARCGGPLDWAQVRVLVWERLGIERVAAVDERPRAAEDEGECSRRDLNPGPQLERLR